MIRNNGRVRVIWGVGVCRVYVCVCNAINDRMVDEAVTAGARSVGRVYKHHACAPRCGKCIPLMREMVQEATGSASPETPALARA